jgi:hypothetical protein
MWRPRLARRFGAIIRPDRLVDLVSCDCRRDFTRVMRARIHGPGGPVEDIQGLAAHLARAEGSASFNHAFRRWTGTLAVCGALGETAARASMSSDRESDPWGLRKLARESRRLAGVSRLRRGRSVF